MNQLKESLARVAASLRNTAMQVEDAVKLIPDETPPFAKGDLVILPDFKETRTDMILKPISEISGLVAYFDDGSFWDLQDLERIEIGAEFTAPFGDEVCEFKVVVRRVPETGDMYLLPPTSATPGSVSEARSSSGRYICWIVELVEKQDEFANGGLVILDTSGHLLLIDHSNSDTHYRLHDKVNGLTYMMNGTHNLSPLTPKSVFTTAYDIGGKKGTAEFVVIGEKRCPRTGDLYLPEIHHLGSVMLSTLDNDYPRWIVAFTDLSRYTKEVEGIAYVMYETDLEDVYELYNSNGAQLRIAVGSIHIVRDFIDSLGLTSVPLPVSNITGFVAPESEKS